MDEADEHNTSRSYWRANLRLLAVLMTVWFLVSFGAGILFREALDRIEIGGTGLGFWFAQQGAIYAFVILVFAYVFLMRRIERRYGLAGDQDDEAGEGDE